jgi:hypothetical protein
LNNHSSKKPIDNLARKLDEVEAKYATYNNDNSSDAKNDGVRWWRGKPIISLHDWLELSNFGEAFTKGGRSARDMNIALQYFPDDTFSWDLFPGVVQPEYVKVTNKWYLKYMQLIFYRKNPKEYPKNYEEWLELKKQSMREEEEEDRKRKERGEDGAWNSWGFK